MSAQLSRSEVGSLLTITGASVGVLLNTFQGDDDGNPLVASIAFSCLAFSATYSSIRWLGDVFMKAGFKGRDMGKLKKTEMSVNERRQVEVTLDADFAIDLRPWELFVPWFTSSPSSCSYPFHSTKTSSPQLLEVVTAMLSCKQSRWRLGVSSIDFRITR